MTNLGGRRRRGTRRPAAALLAGVLAAAGAQALAAPAGGLPIAHGIYVRDGAGCQDPPNAAIISYDGRGLSDPHAHACLDTITARSSAAYRVRTTCIAAGVGPAPRETLVRTITVISHDRIRVARAGEGAVYGLCPAAQLPPGLR